MLVLNKYKSCLCLLLVISSTTVFAESNVKVVGIAGETLKNVEAALSDQKNPSSNEIKIQNAMQPFGYFHPQIISSKTVDKGYFITQYTINPGPRVTIRKIDIVVTGEGKNNNALRLYITNFPLHEGDAYNTIKYNKAKTRLFNLAMNQGYINASFKNKILINPRTNTCTITLNLETGDKYYYGPVSFVSSNYSQDFLNRFIQLGSNQTFSSAKLLKLQQEMENSYYFNQVNIQPDTTNLQNHHIPLKVTTTSDKPIRYSLGVGYGTTSGARLLGGVSLRHLNNEGSHFEGQVRISSLLTGMTGNYYIPGKNPLTDTWVISGNYKMFLPKSGESHSTTFSGGYSTKINSSQITTNLNALVERFYIDPNTWQNAHLLYPSFNYNYLKTDNLINPTYGFNLNFNVTGANQTLFSTTSYIQTDLRVKGLYSLGNMGKLLFRGELGVSAIHDLPSFPLSMRFFAGGLNSIRGFSDSSIGPGKYLQVASLEYQQKIKGNFYAAAFYDLGRASDHFNSPLNRGVGVGLIYNSPIGPLKVYLAQAISKPDKPYSIEFSVGPEFS